MLTSLSLKSYEEVLKRRLQAVRALTETLNDSQGALLSRNHETLQDLTQQQQTFCGEIEFADKELKAAQEIFEACGIGQRDDGIVAIRRELAEAEAELLESYKIHAALLRRARRSVNVMVNVAGSAATAYSSPSSFKSMQASEE